MELPQAGPLVPSETQELNSVRDMEAAMKKGEVVVMFYASWCPHCKTMKPIFSSVASQHEGKVGFIKVDADQYREVGDKWSVDGYPTIKYFSKGKDAGEFSGAADEEDLAKWVDGEAAKS